MKKFLCVRQEDKEEINHKERHEFLMKLTGWSPSYHLSQNQFTLFDSLS